MKITIIGIGYVGLVTGVCFADLGNQVVCVDIDEQKIKCLNKGDVPFYEQGLQDLMRRNLKENRINFTTDVKRGVLDSNMIFICVGTPPDEDDSADLKYVMKAISEVAKHMDGYKIIVLKSTVPVGSNKKITEFLKKQTEHDFEVVSNPEFLREGQAVQDFQNPDRVVIGVRNGKAREVMKNLYRHVERANKPLLIVSPETAELIKYASNAMLATRISFMNQISSLCEEHKADVKKVAVGVGLDDRIGPRFLQAGIGYGGSCFPKDVRALAKMIEDVGEPNNLFSKVEEINEAQKRSLVPKLKGIVSDIKGKRIAVWGLSFKPRTSDIRNSPALTLIKQLKQEGAVVVAFDPEAILEAKKIYPDVTYAESMYAALKSAEAMVLCTEWDEFREPDFNKMKELMNNPVVIDGRNIYDPERMKALGFKYRGVGR